MISIQRLFGKEDRFFDLLVASAEETRQSIVGLTHILRHEEAPSLGEFAEMRKKDKAITQEISDLLVKTFVTALEREDIEALSSALYKIPKTVEKFVERYQMSQDKVASIDFQRHAMMLDEATGLVIQMIQALRKGMDIVKVKNLNDRMQQIEGDADRLMLDCLKDLYSGRYDTLSVVIVSNLYDLLEKVFDRCRDVGNVAKQIAYKNSYAVRMTLILVVILVALAFEFINGFHDTANSIATVVSTKVLTPRQAIMLAAFTNLIGALVGHAVAKTVSSGLVDSQFVTTSTIICALFGGIVWNLLTWWLALPSSSTHALVGGLCGATLATAQNNWDSIIWSQEKMKDGKVVVEGVLHKVILPMLGSPVIGLIGGFIVMALLYALLRHARPMWVNRFFGRAQIFSAGYMGFAHGLADAQKTMGIITLALVTATTAGSFETLPKWLGFLKMEKTPAAEQLLLTVIDRSHTLETAALLEEEGFKMKSGEFREAFLSLAAEVHEDLGDHEGAARTRADVTEDYQLNLTRENARLLPKLPLIGPIAAAKPTDWIAALQAEGARAESEGGEALSAMAAKVRELAPDVPPWIKIICALVMAAGTASGGWRIIKTMGHKMVKLQPVHGFAAETTAATLLAVTGKLGMTVSTTHAITTAIMGVGATKRFSAIDMKIVKKILGAWILTLPAAGLVAYFSMWLWLKLAS